MSHETHCVAPVGSKGHSQEKIMAPVRTVTSHTVVLGSISSMNPPVTGRPTLLLWHDVTMPFHCLQYVTQCLNPSCQSFVLFPSFSTVNLSFLLGHYPVSMPLVFRAQMGNTGLNSALTRFILKLFVWQRCDQGLVKSPGLFVCMGSC